MPMRSLSMACNINHNKHNIGVKSPNTQINVKGEAIFFRCRGGNIIRILGFVQYCRKWVFCH